MMHTAEHPPPQHKILVCIALHMQICIEDGQGLTDELHQNMVCRLQHPQRIPNISSSQSLFPLSSHSRPPSMITKFENAHHAWTMTYCNCISGLGNEWAWRNFASSDNTTKSAERIRNNYFNIHCRRPYLRS